MKLALGKSLQPDLAAQLEAQEVAMIRDLEARGDCQVMVAVEGDRLAGYAVFGLDDGGLVTVYMARAVYGLVAKAAMIGMFNAAKIAKVPVRVHTEKLQAMARMMGADFAFPAIDGDGVPMGVFHA